VDDAWDWETHPNMDGGHDLMRELFKSWTEWTGCSTYPVPHPSQSEIHAYLYPDDPDLWGDHEYGRARRRLLDFMITTLEQLQ
jgi:hypothetical protein